MFGRFDQPISAILLVISFSRVVWMLEKAGVSHLIVLKHMHSVRSCTENIVHWWIVEHQEWCNDPEDKGFPRDQAMDRELMPTNAYPAVDGDVKIWWNLA